MRKRPTNLSTAILLACVVAALPVVGPSCSGDIKPSSRRDLHQALSALEVRRTIGPRLSAAVTYRACTDTIIRVIPETHCGPTPHESPTPAVLDLSARVSAAIREHNDAVSLHTAALLELVSNHEPGDSLNRVVTILENVARLTDPPSAVLADVAAAYIVRAERTQSPRDLFDAVENAEHALELDPRNAAALFNRALAEERLGLVTSARRAWEDYVRVDPGSTWAAEARQHVRALSRVHAQPKMPPRDASPNDFGVFASEFPQPAWSLGWVDLLGEWAAAIERGDSAVAASRLTASAALGDALVRRGGDVTLAEAIASIRAKALDLGATRVLAAAHRNFAAGVAAYDSGRYQVSEQHFDSVLTARPPSRALTVWATVFKGTTFMHAGKTALVQETLLPITRGADTVRQSSLLGHAYTALGTSALRAGQYESALDAYQHAADAYGRAGESEHLASMYALVAQAQLALGDAREAFVSLHRALTALRSLPESVRMHNVLYALGKAVASEGMMRSATVVADEDVDASMRAKFAINVVEAMLVRARFRWSTGQTRLAAEDRVAARAAIGSLTSVDARDWFTAHLQQVDAESKVATEPLTAVAELDSAANYFGKRSNALRVLPALVARAEAQLSRGDAVAAESDLASAVELLAKQRDSIGRMEYRVSMLESAQRIFDRLVMLRLAAGKSDDALTYLELGRSSLSPTGAKAGGKRPDVATLRIPGAVAVEYALVGDTLLAWVLNGVSTRVARTTVSRDSLTLVANRARSSLEFGTADSVTMSDLSRLYEWVVRPVVGDLGSSGTPLVVIADGDIAAVPFAALRDPASSSYLIESHPIRFASSLRDASSPALRTQSRAAVYLVGNPSTRTSADGMAALPGVTEEVTLLADIYPRAKTVAGQRATRQSFTEAMQRAGILHFAGHAVFDNDRPERSYLVLASDSTSPATSDRILATEFARSDLRGLRLVVLSACETLHAHEGRGGAVSGLAAAFLAAGAGGVVGADWRVDDRLTRDFMVAFHRAYRELDDGPRALQAAQLAMLRSADASHRAPTAWAAFRYAGS